MKYFFKLNNKAKGNAHRLPAQRPAFVESNCSTLTFRFSIFIGITKALECWGERRLKGPRGAALLPQRPKAAGAQLSMLHTFRWYSFLPHFKAF